MDEDANQQSKLKIQLEQMIAGDPKAFEEILYAYEKSIFNHLRRLTGNSDDAADLLQETFVRLYKKRGQIDVSNNFKNWLYAIATNIAYDHFRKKKHEKLIFIDDESELETIGQETSYTTIDLEILEHDLESALREVRTHYRNILLLYYKERFSYKEIADILGLPLNTVKTHLRRAKEELGGLLKKTYG